MFNEHILEQMRILIHDLLEGCDRVAAIIGGAFIDDTLKQLLQVRLLAQFHGTKMRGAKKAIEVVEQLFEPDRPLGTFSARTDICLALGLIGPVAHSDLTYIRKVRNRFAHFVTLPDGSGAIDTVSFKTPQIINWCSNLKYLQTQPKPIKRPSNARDQFSGTCILLSLFIAGKALEMSATLQEKGALDEDRPFLR